MEKNQIRVKIRDILGISVNLDSWKAGCSSKSGFWFSPLRTFWLTLYNYDLHLHFTGVWWHFRWTFNPETLQLRCHKSTQPQIPPDWPQPLLSASAPGEGSWSAPAEQFWSSRVRTGAPSFPVWSCPSVKKHTNSALLSWRFHNGTSLLHLYFSKPTFSEALVSACLLNWDVS